MLVKSFALLVCLFLTACGTAGKEYASDAAMAAPDAHYFAPPPRTITLFTSINGKTGSGAHSSLLINASEQVQFDPAGSFSHPRVPERNDVHYGMTPKMVAFYIDYHARDSARENFYVIEQTVTVSPAVAELIKQKVEANGAVDKAHCAESISAILRSVPGFDAISSTWFPKKLSKDFDVLPGVRKRIITEATADHSHGVILTDPNNPAF